VFYNRWFNSIKTTSISQIKKSYPEHADEIARIDKGEYKEYVARVMKPIDTLFLKIGNALISICDGFTNKDSELDVIASLTDTLKSTVDELRSTASEKTRSKLEYELNRLQELDNKINAEEGITFMYKGRLMKLTGSFAPLNQILGSIKFSK
jgi:archaellum component FlaC